jgi:hypothetical protein
MTEKQVVQKVVSTTNRTFRSALVMKNNSTILTLICFGGISISMFLPFYESTEARGLFFFEESFVLIESYKSPELGVTLLVFNGFGSVFALLNLVVAILLVVSRFFFPRSFPTAISSGFLFISSLILLIYTTSEKKGGILQDEMRAGFYLMLICQVVLIAQSFIRAITETPNDRRSDSDILDF